MVHPHLRGAYAALPRQQLIFPGSSPHTWGIRGRFQSRRLEQRFIPTYVGHTAANVFASACTSGSSPHTWGILERVVNHFRDLRFIPTYVGHTDGRLSIQLIPAGSSPPTWGIPVCTRRTRWNKSVLPHLRGAYFFLACQIHHNQGSSPPTWGIHDIISLKGQRIRFIPTYVGHTQSRLSQPPQRSVHPHLRGAYSNQMQDQVFQPGSSPPTWGILPFSPAVPSVARFIPTYVGHTVISGIQKFDTAVHPHLRGAYRCSLFGSLRPGGSSPPTWGIRGRVKDQFGLDAVHPHLRGAYGLSSIQYRLPIRFIPTYVGHTLDRRKKNGWFQPLFL